MTIQDSEISKTRKKLFPRERPPLVIETIVREVPKVDPFRSFSKQYSTEGHVNRVSLPRVKWLERPDV